MTDVFNPDYDDDREAELSVAQQMMNAQLEQRVALLRRFQADAARRSTPDDADGADGNR